MTETGLRGGRRRKGCRVAVTETRCGDTGRRTKGKRGAVATKRRTIEAPRDEDDEEDEDDEDEEDEKERNKRRKGRRRRGERRNIGGRRKPTE